jgi:hypothetical protein
VGGVLGYWLLRMGSCIQEIARGVTTYVGTWLELALCGLIACIYALMGYTFGWHLRWLFEVGGCFGWGLLSVGPAAVAEHPLAGPLAPQVLSALVSSPLVVDPHAWGVLVF